MTERDPKGSERNPLPEVRRPSAWPERMVRLLDDGLKLPFLKKGIGFDAVIGFFLPVAGDTITGVGSLTLLAAALKRGVPTVILLRMVLNIGVDVLIGSIPFVGDVFDIFWRSNRRNLDLIEAHEGKKKSASATDYLVVGLGVVGAVATVAVPFLIISYVGVQLGELVRSLW